LRGTLLEADATSQEAGTIEVIGVDGTKSRINVPRGMMRDIVKPMFEEQVVVLAVPDLRGTYKLTSIDLADDDAGGA
jgi:hypothetical protein